MISGPKSASSSSAASACSRSSPPRLRIEPVDQHRADDRADAGVARPRARPRSRASTCRRTGWSRSGSSRLRPAGCPSRRPRARASPRRARSSSRSHSISGRSSPKPRNRVIAAWVWPLTNGGQSSSPSGRRSPRRPAPRLDLRAERGDQPVLAADRRRSRRRASASSTRQAHAASLMTASELDRDHVAVADDVVAALGPQQCRGRGRRRSRPRPPARPRPTTSALTKPPGCRVWTLPAAS